MVRLRVSVALRAGRVFGAGGLGKAAAEPPHSKSSRRGGVAGARRLMLTQLDKRWLRRYRKRRPRLLLLAAGIHAILTTQKKLEDFMPNGYNSRAAEFHEMAAHAHRAAAAHHGKEDHLSGHEQARQAMEHANKAHEASQQAFNESQIAAGKHKKS
jgi:hypothetical protein